MFIFKIFAKQLYRQGVIRIAALDGFAIDVISLKLV
jgi:hypothetical protein